MTVPLALVSSMARGTVIHRGLFVRWPYLPGRAFGTPEPPGLIAKVVCNEAPVLDVEST